MQMDEEVVGVLPRDEGMMSQLQHVDVMVQPRCHE